MDYSVDVLLKTKVFAFLQLAFETDLLALRAFSQQLRELKFILSLNV